MTKKDETKKAKKTTIKKVEKKVVKKEEIVEEEQQNNSFFYVLVICSIVVLVVFAEFFINRKIDDLVLVQLNYVESGNSSYTVHYKKNPYYSEIADLSQPIMTQYVDNIDVNFNYLHNYSNEVEGVYKYQVTAKLKVYDPTDESVIYWSPKYDLTDQKSIDFKDLKSYRVTENVTVDYVKFLNNYLDYKSKSSLATKAKLIVNFEVINDGRYTDIESIKHDANMSLEIPLSEAAFKITKVDIDSNQKFINSKSNRIKKLVYTIIGIDCWIGAIGLTGLLIFKYRENVLSQSLYSRTLKKILNSYDSIIVNVEKLPDVSGLSVVNVTTFEELVDAQMEVRLPINFKEDTKKHVAKFVLVRNSIVWVYTLEEGNLSEK